MKLNEIQENPKLKNHIIGPAKLNMSDSEMAQFKRSVRMLGVYRTLSVTMTDPKFNLYQVRGMEKDWNAFLTDFANVASYFTVAIDADDYEDKVNDH